MSSQESRDEITRLVTIRQLRDMCVGNALTIGIIDKERADSMRRSDDLQQIITGLGEDLLRYARAYDMTPERFVHMAAAVFGWMPDLSTE